jgi:carboxymethylenebutenolidase
MPTLIFEPPGPGPYPGLVIAQHLPIAHAGLEKDPFTTAVGERFAAAGFACAIPYLFHWWPEGADPADKRAAFRDDWTVADLTAAFDLLSEVTPVDPRRTGIVGHCWGGRIAWLGACHNPSYRACVVFYGGRIMTSFADGGPPPIQLADRIRCPVLGIFGNEDTNPSRQDVDEYEAALQRAGVPHVFHRYDGAGHGFQDFHNPERYRRVQSEDAWGKAIAFLNDKLGQAG